MNAMAKIIEALPKDDRYVENPANPAHAMVIKPVEGRVEIYFGDTLLARSRQAKRVLEFGKSVYDPMIYIPKSDLTAVLTPQAKTSVCPLKGTASYVSYGDEEIAWSYAPYAFADELKDHFCFWPSKVRLVEQP